MKKSLFEHGFSKEEAGDVAVGLFLFDQWLEHPEEYMDERYASLYRDYSNDVGIGSMMMAAFFGGFSKAMDLCMKIEEEEKQQSAG